MDVKKKKLICVLAAIIGLAVLILELFVFQAPDGVLGFIICMSGIYLLTGGIIGFCKYSGNFFETLAGFLDILFWLP